ncbi:unnamed protein product [Cutaneotrichosporon oleaginosum]
MRPVHLLDRLPVRDRHPEIPEKIKRRLGATEGSMLIHLPALFVRDIQSIFPQEEEVGWEHAGTLAPLTRGFWSEKAAASPIRGNSNGQVTTRSAQLTGT